MNIMKKYTGKLFCFSPPVMIATFIIEIALAAFAVWRYKLNTVSRLVVLLLVFLAIFQLAEYMLCGGFGVDGFTWARIGYVSITLLPPLGLHLATVLAGVKKRGLVTAGYISAALFVLFFAFVGQAISLGVCHGNYVIFEMAPGSSWLYAFYYYGWLLTGAWLSYKWGKLTKSATKQQALFGLGIGYAAFLLPTSTLNLLVPSTIAGIPSIMCGFAVLLALT